MAATKRATINEVQEAWAHAERYWESLTDKMDFPWTRAGFCINIMCTVLQQRGLRPPPEAGMLGVRR